MQTVFVKSEFISLLLLGFVAIVIASGPIVSVDFKLSLLLLRLVAIVIASGPVFR